MKDAIKELYGGSKCTKLVATILLTNLCNVHGVSNKFANELFALLRLHLLLTDNCLPNNYYVTKTLTRISRLDYKNIHACGRRCVLYQGEYKDVVYCPKCGASPYKDEMNKLFPMKMLRHFPIILRLQRMFRTPTMSKLMLWHSQNSSQNGLIRHQCDSKAWRQIHEKFPTLALDARNVHLALIVDGVNPYKLNHSTWSTWLVTLLNYNIPPWFCSRATNGNYEDF